MFYFDLTAVTLCILEGVDCVAVELYPVIKKRCFCYFVNLIYINEGADQSTLGLNLVSEFPNLLQNHKYDLILNSLIILHIKLQLFSALFNSGLVCNRSHSL